MWRPILVTPPSEAVVSLDEIKAHCRVDDSEDDTLLIGLVTAAVKHLDGWSGILGRCLVTQTWRVDLADWPLCDDLRLPFPDVATIDLKYFDTDNVEQTVATSLYEILDDATGAFIRFTDSFTRPSVYDDRSDGVQITITAGFGNADSVPEDIKVAVKMLVSHWYHNREAVTMGGLSKVPLGVEAILAPYRRMAL